jgi:hypothetical protein
MNNKRKKKECKSLSSFPQFYTNPKHCPSLRVPHGIDHDLCCNHFAVQLFLLPALQTCFLTSLQIFPRRLPNIGVHWQSQHCLIKLHLEHQRHRIPRIQAQFSITTGIQRPGWVYRTRIPAILLPGIEWEEIDECLCLYCTVSSNCGTVQWHHFTSDKRILEAPFPLLVFFRCN